MNDTEMKGALALVERRTRILSAAEGYLAAEANRHESLERHREIVAEERARLAAAGRELERVERAARGEPEPVPHPRPRRTAR